MSESLDQDDGEEARDRGSREGNSRRRKPTKLPHCVVPADSPPTFYSHGKFGVRLMERPLLALGWKRTSDKYAEHVKLKWMHHPQRIDYIAFREGKQMLRQIPNCHQMTNKLQLLRSLEAYERLAFFHKGRPPRLRMSDFHPETYCLDERLGRITFLNLYQDGEMWLSKPAGLDRGKGITLLRSREQIDKILAPCAKERIKSRPRIIQRYIANPLLLDGRKFDIRNYMVIASTVPYLVLFHHGFGRLSCFHYDTDNGSRTVHLTNQALQKRVPNFKDMKEDTVWSMEKINEYINENIAPEKGIQQNWVFNRLDKQMQRIMLHCFRSVEGKLERRIGYFDFFGFDFMIDTDMKVWLLEVNLNPSMDTGCKVLKELKRDLVKEVLYVSIEAFEKSRKKQPLQPLQSLKNCVVLHCGTASSNVAGTRQSCSVPPANGQSSKRKKRTRRAKTPEDGRRSQHSSTSLPRIDASTTKVSPYVTSGFKCTQKTLPDIFYLYQP